MTTWLCIILSAPCLSLAVRHFICLKNRNYCAELAAVLHQWLPRGTPLSFTNHHLCLPSLLPTYSHASYPLVCSSFCSKAFPLPPWSKLSAVHTCSRKHGVLASECAGDISSSGPCLKPWALAGAPTQSMLTLALIPYTFIQWVRLVEKESGEGIRKRKGGIVSVSAKSLLQVLSPAVFILST